MNIPLKIALVERGFRQLELSKFLRIDPSRLSKIVNGWIKPDENTKKEISRFLGKPVEDIFPDSSQ